MTSTELRKILNGMISEAGCMPTVYNPGIKEESETSGKLKRSSLEGPLQRLQMGGWLLIADFEYKLTRTGERYGWGVALYSTPEIWFGKLPQTQRTPSESFEFLVSALASRLPFGNKKAIRKLLE